jgi:hypothetical protein
MSFTAKAAGLTVVEREISMVGVREEVLHLAEKYLSLLKIGEMSITVLEDRMEDLERDEWCFDVDRDRETFAHWRMMPPFTWVFAKCPMPFRKGTERLLRRVPRNLPLLLRVTCHFGCRTGFGGATGNEETERDMTGR